MFLPNRPRSGIFAANLNSINDKNYVTMKKSLQMILMAAAIAAASCSTDENDLFEEWGVQPGQENMMPGGTNDSNGSASIGDLTSFDIQLNEETLTESETIPADDEDYIENNTFDNSIAIVYNGTSATVSGDVDGVEVSVNGAHVTVNSTVKCAYELSGNSSDGSFKLYSEKKYSVVMNNLTLTNPTGPAINSQSGKRGYYVMADGTYLTLSSGDNTLLVFKTPRNYQAYTVVISTPAMKKGSTCTLTSGATVSGGTDFDGLLSGATATGGTTLASLSLSSMVTTQNYNAMGGGGGNKNRL